MKAPTAPRNYAMEIAQALAKADSQSLAVIGFELLESLGEARHAIASFEARKARDRERKKRPIPRNSAPSTENVESSPFSPTPPFSPPTSSTSSSASGRVWRPDDEARLARRLPSDAGRLALSAVLARCGDKVAVAAEVRMILDGGRPNVSAKPEHVELALCDYAANEMRWASALFRTYVQRASKPQVIRGEGPRRGGTGQRSHDNAVEALKDFPEGA